MYGTKTPAVKLSIDKYITEVNDTSLSVLNSSDNCVCTLSDRKEKSNNIKSRDAVEVTVGDTITYKIEIKNSAGGTGKNINFTDEFNPNFFTYEECTISSGFSWSTSPSAENGKITGVIKEIGGNATVEIIVKLKVREDKFISSDSILINTASFEYKTQTSESKDYSKVCYITINKYIESIENVDSSLASSTISDRSSWTDEQKANSPAYGGYSKVDDIVYNKIVTYRIEIKNNRSFAIIGTFSDNLNYEKNNKIKLIHIQDIGSGLTWGPDTNTGIQIDNIRIESGETKVFMIVALTTFNGETDDNGTYENKATYKYNLTTIKSYDYFYVDHYKTPVYDANIKKYISDVSGGTSGAYLVDNNRLEMSTLDKELCPAEVSTGSIVTYEIEVTNLVYYENNTIGRDHDGNPSIHEGECILDEFSCIDTFDNGLEFVSAEINDHTGSTSGCALERKYN